MSALSPVEHQRLIFSILQHLQSLVDNPSVDGLSLNSEQLKSAISSIEQATGISLNDSEQNCKFFVSKTLSQIFASSTENDFKRFLETLEGKGYFDNVDRGSKEYEELVKKAREKFNPGKTTKTKKQKIVPHIPELDESLASLSLIERTIKAEEFKTKGNKRLTSKLYQEAIELYSQAISLNGKSAVYFANRAAAYTALEKYEYAIADSKRAIELDPNYSKAYSRLGFAYYSLGKHQKALDKGYLHALRLDPENKALKDSIAAAETALGKPTGSSTTVTNPLENLGNLGNLSEFFNNPAVRQTAEAFAKDPSMRQMTEKFMSNPEMVNMFSKMMEGNPQLVENMMQNFKN